MNWVHVWLGVCIGGSLALMGVMVYQKWRDDQECAARHQQIEQDFPKIVEDAYREACRQKSLAELLDAQTTYREKAEWN